MTLERTWMQIDDWVRRNVPALHATLLPPPSAEDVEAASIAIGHVLPADLAAWWQEFGGIGETSLLWDLIPEFWQPQGLGDALRDRAMIMEVRNDLFSTSPEERQTLEAAALREPAGTLNGELWLSAWVPVATNLGGSHLFVDLRGGPRHGCVMEWDNVEGADSEPLFASVASMLDHSSRALRGETGRRAVVKDGYFSWE